MLIESNNEINTLKFQIETLLERMKLALQNNRGIKLSSQELYLLSLTILGESING